MSDFEQQISDLTHSSVDSRLAMWVEASAKSELAWNQLLRFLEASINPATQLSAIVGSGELGERLIKVLGASQQQGDVLVQNPEFASLILDPHFMAATISFENLCAEATQLLQVSNSYLHSLDRIRLLKQKTLLRIFAEDVCGTSADHTWNELSTLADVCIQNVSTVVWENLCEELGMNREFPFQIVAFGKLGGNELNYSSDIDLVYLADDDFPDEDDKLANKFCTRLTHALSERMGRGALYRVDLRLRPFGGTGQVFSRFAAIESYYRLYAESWEHLALIRSRIVVGNEASKTRWNELRREICFSSARGEWVIQEILEMRGRMDAFASPADIKRGAGGIRDIEFIVQLFQLLVGWKYERLQGKNTLEMLVELKDIPEAKDVDCNLLSEALCYLRALEHRMQAVSDLQTHELPSSEETLLQLGKLLGFSNSEDLIAKTVQIREKVDAEFRRLFPVQARPPRESVLEMLDSQIAQNWLDSHPSSGMLYSVILENEKSLCAIQDVTEHCPVLIPVFQANPWLTEQLISTELFDEPGGATVFESEAACVRFLVREVAGSIVRNLNDPITIGAELDRTYTEVFSQLAPDTISIVALGSAASKELTFQSDVDLIFVAKDAHFVAEAEASAEIFLREIEALRAEGSTLSIDLRLRPDGKSGLLVRTLAGLEQYANSEMSPWEWFALSRSRLIIGDPVAQQTVSEIAYMGRINRQILDGLLAIKHRVETERVSPPNVWRDVKLGHGGLMDIEWTIEFLLRESYNETPQSPMFYDRVSKVESQHQAKLIAAWEHHSRTRHWISLQNWELNIVPENPAKLDYLAARFVLSSGNEWLEIDIEHRKQVRELYLQVVERLKK